MGLYDKVETVVNKIDIFKYEKIIELIKSYYNPYSVESLNLNYDIRAEYCLKNGLYGFNYYLHYYLNSKTVDKDILTFINNIDIDEEKEISEKIDYANSFFSKLIDLPSDAKKLNDYEKLDYLHSILQEDPNWFLDYTDEIDYDFLILASGMSDKYYEIYNSILENMNNNISQEDEIKYFVSEMKKRNIVIDRNEIFNYYWNLSKERHNKIEYIKKILKDNEKSNMYIEIANRLRDRVKSEIAEGRDTDEVLNKVLPEAYGLVMAACEKALGITPYDVQLMGAIALNEGKISEMYTGEGKTITALFPAFLNSLTGKEVDIFTPNDYLASRDAKEASKVFKLLGMDVGCVKFNDQSDEEKKEQYRCDIVYGSSNAFAFDYLADLDKSTEDMLGRNESPFYAIVDEADQILIDNALSPFQLVSGEKKATIKSKKQDIEIINNLKTALSIEKELSKNVGQFLSQDSFNKYINDPDYYNEYDEKYSLLIGPNSYHITSKGEQEIFYYYMHDDIVELSNKAKNIIIDDDEYQENVDYTIEGDSLVLTPKGLVKASYNISEFQDLRMKWVTDPKCIDIIHYINNALTAEYILEKGEDYEVVEDKETKEKKIVLLQSGRILENSKYQHGLHYALELKENIPVLKSQSDTLEEQIISTISPRALLSRYSKISGMTGTADKSAFLDIYKLDTFEVPKNKEYQYEKGYINTPPKQRKDSPVKVFRTEEEKTDAIIQDIIESNKKGQPILVVTDNDEKAAELYEKIEKEYGLDPKLLISSKNLEEEAQIVSNAGMSGSITIASQMAGRGTDIKLAGDFEKNKEMYIDVALLCGSLEIEAKEEYENATHNVTKEQFINNYVEKHLYEFQSNPDKCREHIIKYREKYERDLSFESMINRLALKKYENTKSQIEKSGGLKYIQMNPFITSRNDMQGKGRVARQGEAGETVTYACLDDLKRINVDSDSIKRIDSLLTSRGYLDSEDVQVVVDEAIETAQSNNEFEYDLRIALNDSMDYSMNSLGMSLLKYRKKLKESENPEIQFDKIIDQVIENAIIDNVPKRKQKKVKNNSYYLYKLKLDYPSLISDINDIFGINLDEKDIEESCDYVGNLKDYIFDLAKEKQSEVFIGKNSDEINDNIKNNLTKSFDNMYQTFIYSCENIRLQEINDQIAQNTSHDRKIDLNEMFNDCVNNGFRECVKNVFKPFIRSKDENNNTSSTIEYRDYIEGLPSIEESSPIKK